MIRAMARARHMTRWRTVALFLFFWAVLTLSGCRLGFELTGADSDAAPAPAPADASQRLDASAGLDADPVTPDGSAMPGDGPPDTPGCLPGYTEEPWGGCYRMVIGPADWLTAELDCEDDAPGSHLVVIDDGTENDYVPDYTWTGLTERITGDGIFTTVTGLSMPFDGFAVGEPVPGGAACAVTRPDGWHDDNCPEAKMYMCEFDGLPADPTSY